MTNENLLEHSEGQGNPIVWGDVQTHPEDNKTDIEVTLGSWAETFYRGVESTIVKEGAAGVIGLHEMHLAQAEIAGIREVLSKRGGSELNPAKIGLIGRVATAEATVQRVSRSIKFGDPGYSQELISTYNSLRAHVDLIEGINVDRASRMVLEKVRIMANEQTRR